MGFEPSTVAKNERVFTVHPLHSHLYSLKLVSYEFPIYVVDGLQDWTEAGLIEMWPEHPYPTKKKIIEFLLTLTLINVTEYNLCFEKRDFKCPYIILLLISFLIKVSTHPQILDFTKTKWLYICYIFKQKERERVT